MQRCHTCGFCLACGDVDPGLGCPVCGAHAGAPESFPVAPKS